MTTSNSEPLSTDPKLDMLCQIARTAVFPINLGDAGYFGLSKRELFAAMMMQGRLAAETEEFSCHINTHAEQAVIAADALLKELAK